MLLSNCLYGQQQSLLSKAYFFAEVTPPQFRWFDHKITKHSPHSYSSLINTLGDWDDIYRGIGVRINSKMTLEMGYYWLNYWDGVDVKNTTCEWGGGGSSGNIEVANHYSLKFSYSLFKFYLLKKPIKFYCGVGYTYARQDGGKTLSRTYGIIFPCREPQDTGRYFVRSIEHIADLAEDFHLLEANFKFDYEFSKYVSFTTTIGFNQGFETLGKSEFKYYTTGEPTYYAESETKGSNIYCSIGLRLAPFVDVEKRNRKSKKRRTKPQKRYVE